jgi:DUF2934 family protein
MEGQSQARSGKKTAIRYQRQPLDKPSMPNEAFLPAEEDKHKNKEAHASTDSQAKGMSEEDQTRVAELAYGLYEQRGRKDGHDLEDWFNAEQQVMTQRRLSRLKW